MSMSSDGGDDTQSSDGDMPSAKPSTEAVEHNDTNTHENPSQRDNELMPSNKRKRRSPTLDYNADAGAPGSASSYVPTGFYVQQNDDFHMCAQQLQDHFSCELPTITGYGEFGVVYRSDGPNGRSRIFKVLNQYDGKKIPKEFTKEGRMFYESDNIQSDDLRYFMCPTTVTILRNLGSLGGFLGVLEMPVGGPSLDQFMQKNKKQGLEWRDGRELMTQLLAALEALWKGDLLHGDLGTKNVLVTDTGPCDTGPCFTVQLIDFGLSYNACELRNLDQRQATYWFTRDYYGARHLFKEVLGHITKNTPYQRNVQQGLESLGDMTYNPVWSTSNKLQFGALLGFLQDFKSNTKFKQWPVN